MHVHAIACALLNEIKYCLCIAHEFRGTAAGQLQTHADLDSPVGEALGQGGADARAMDRCENVGKARLECHHARARPP